MNVDLGVLESLVISCIRAVELGPRDASIQMASDLKEAAEVSMGTEITITDIISIKALADQVSIEVCQPGENHTVS